MTTTTTNAVVATNTKVVICSAGALVMKGVVHMTNPCPNMTSFALSYGPFREPPFFAAFILCLSSHIVYKKNSYRRSVNLK
jgi:hypothetical protein